MWIPLPTRDDVDLIPLGSAEEALEFLDDLAVSSHRSMESLQVAGDHKGEVVQVVVCGHGERATGLDLVHLTVTEERPDVRVGCILDPAVGEIAVELGLIDRVNGTQSHRHRGELPKLRHESRVRVGA
jgi:hypothetical protein